MTEDTMHIYVSIVQDSDLGSPSARHSETRTHTIPFRYTPANTFNGRTDKIAEAGYSPLHSPEASMTITVKMSDSLREVGRPTRPSDFTETGGLFDLALDNDSFLRMGQSMKTFSGVSQTKFILNNTLEMVSGMDLR